MMHKCFSHGQQMHPKKGWARKKKAKGNGYEKTLCYRFCNTLRVRAGTIGGQCLYWKCEYSILGDDQYPAGKRCECNVSGYCDADPLSGLHQIPEFRLAQLLKNDGSDAVCRNALPLKSLPHFIHFRDRGRSDNVSDTQV